MAMISRFYPEGGTDAEKEEMMRIIKAVRKNYPGVIPELLPTSEVIKWYASSVVWRLGSSGIAKWSSGE